MTSPNTADYPDYNRLASIVGPPIVSGDQALAAAAQYGPFPIGAYESLRLQLIGRTPGAVFRVIVYYLDLKLNPVAGYVTEYETDVNCSVNDVLPVMGAWVQINVDLLAGAYPATITLNATPLVSIPPRSAGANVAPLFVSTVNLGVNAEQTFELQTVVPGAAWLNVFSTQKSWWVRLWELAAGARGALLCSVDSTGQRQAASQGFAIGRRPVQVDVADTSGAGQTMNVAVVTVL